MLPPAHELRFTFSRSGGPGGQNVNKVNSKATLHWIPARSELAAGILGRFERRFAAHINLEGEFQISCQRSREQSVNRKECLERLNVMLEAVRRPPRPRRPTKPSRAARERRLAAKRRRSELKRRRSEE